jgi:putative spermidine/putrescine transport system permease protein
MRTARNDSFGGGFRRRDACLRIVSRFHVADVLLLLPAAGLLLVFYLFPILNVLVVSVVEPRLGLGNYVELFSSPPLRTIFGTTFRIAAETTCTSLVLGYSIAYALVQGASRLLLLCVLLPFWISTLVRAFSWMVILRSKGLLNSALSALHLQPLNLMFNEPAVVIGMVHYMVPLAALTMYAQMRSIDLRLVQAARGLGARPLEAFLRVFLPLTVPGIIAATVLIFISASGFFIIPAILGGGKSLMIAEYISFLITQTLNWGLGTALATTLALLVLALLGILSKFVKITQLFGGR